MTDRTAIFAAVKAARGGAGFSAMEVAQLDDCLDRLKVPRAASAVPSPNTVPSARRIGAAGLALIKSFEGKRLTAYKCPAGVWTIGYGSTGPHVRPGMTISEAEAEALLRKDLARFENTVAAALPNATQNQFDAMVSLAFNIGSAAFAQSTVVRRAKAGNHAGAADAFHMWNKAGGQEIAGLVRRRAAEAALYLKG